jgi:hypothetical protein
MFGVWLMTKKDEGIQMLIEWYEIMKRHDRGERPRGNL